MAPTTRGHVRPQSTPAIRNPMKTSVVGALNAAWSLLAAPGKGQVDIFDAVAIKFDRYL